MIKSRQLEINGRRLPLPESKASKGHYLEILQAVVGQMDAMLSMHCKILVVRMDIRLHDGTDTNQVMSEIMRKYRKRVRLRHGQHHLGFIWCREQDKTDHQHYHCALLFDANKNQHPADLIFVLEDICEGWDLPKPYTPKNCYQLIKRGDDQAFASCFERLSYLAKVATKGTRPKATNDYSSSRLKPRQPKPKTRTE